MVHVQEGLRILGELVELQVVPDFVVLVAEPRPVELGALWVELVPHGELLHDGLLKGGVPSDVGKVPHQVQQTLERHVVPVHVLQ